MVILMGSFQLEIVYDSMLQPTEIKTVLKTVLSRVKPTTGNFAEYEKVISSETLKEYQRNLPSPTNTGQLWYLWQQVSSGKSVF